MFIAICNTFYELLIIRIDAILLNDKMKLFYQ
jgi:hypothetical protein